MVLYAICLVAAGTLLGTFARLPVLLAVLSAVIVALVIGSGLSLVGLANPSSTAANVVVAIVAVQVGYGVGVILRAIRERFPIPRSRRRPIGPCRIRRSQPAAPNIPAPDIACDRSAGPARPPTERCGTILVGWHIARSWTSNEGQAFH
jgi:hypothetical protein